jgi:hypothetical protein
MTTQLVPRLSHTQLIQLRGICRIKNAIEVEDVQLHPDDSLSCGTWTKRLNAQGHLLGFKSKLDPPPEHSNLAGDVFMLMFQTSWQHRMFRKYGNRILASMLHTIRQCTGTCN